MEYGRNLNHAGMECHLRNEGEPVNNTTPERNKAIVLEALEALFNKRDYKAAERFWSANYIQHSAHIPAGRDGLLGMIKGLPPTLKYEPGVVVADGD
jgi:predicted SnoaL-like aldol condensation-catalyzing enzyme